MIYFCLLYGLLDYVWLLIGWFSNPRDETEIVAGIATVVAYGGFLTQSINQSIIMMSTPFAFDILENSMRIMVDDDDIRMVLFQRSTKGTPELVIRLWHGYTSVMARHLAIGEGRSVMLTCFLCCVCVCVCVHQKRPLEVVDRPDTVAGLNPRITAVGTW